ncbi:MAG: hypothetical protein ABI364_00355 [Caldimonas sp.]
MLLLVVCTASHAQTAPRAIRTTPASAPASRPATSMARAPSPPSGAETNLIELQTRVGQRATATQMTKGMMDSLNAGAHAVAGNIGDGGAASGCRSCKASAKRP